MHKTVGEITTLSQRNLSKTTTGHFLHRRIRVVESACT